jgi:3-deoxy-D-manno-octulosonic-acid transferase
VRVALDTLALAVVQSEEDATRLVELGLARERVEVSGNLKFDLDTNAEGGPITDELRVRFALNAGRPLLVAASTHTPEERIVLEAFKLLRDSSDSETKPRLLIAPRHPERFNEIASLLDSSGLAWARRSAAPTAEDAHCDVILLDTVGELRAIYPLAEIVFVGGSIAPTGGHNVLEPAHAARCIVTGPHTFNFTEIIRRLVEADALVQLPALTEAETPALLARTFNELLTDDAQRRRLVTNALAVLEQNRGATARTVELLAPLIKK